MECLHENSRLEVAIENAAEPHATETPGTDHRIGTLTFEALLDFFDDVIGDKRR